MKKILYNSCMILSAAALLMACEKTEVKDAGGKTLFKLEDAGGDPVILALNTDPAIETLHIGRLIRDAAKNSDYNSPATITVTNAQALLDEWNADPLNDTEYELLPAGSFTVTSATGATVNGNSWTFNFAAKELDRN